MLEISVAIMSFEIFSRVTSRADMFMGAEDPGVMKLPAVCSS